MIWYILIGSLPAAIVGIAIEEYAETIFRSPLWVGVNMAFFGTLLYLVDRFGKKSKKTDNITLIDALFVGIAQCLAIIPGTSRSGVTITAGIFRKMDRYTAARFSFLLSTPIVGASGA